MLSEEIPRALHANGKNRVVSSFYFDDAPRADTVMPEFSAAKGKNATDSMYDNCLTGKNALMKIPAQRLFYRERGVKARRPRRQKGGYGVEKVKAGRRKPRPRYS